MLLFVLANLLAAASLPADNIYKYQDENGIWHFTDRAPKDPKIEFDTVFMQREPEHRVQLRQVGSRESPIYAVFNDYHGPVEVEMKLVDATNIITEPPMPTRMVVPGQKELVMAGLAALDPKQGFSYKVNLASVPGEPIPQKVTGIVAWPPIEPGTDFPISQAFHGTSTHQSPENAYAVDIAMPVGTNIHAAIGGRVMDIEEDFNEGGTDAKRYAHKANHIRILHADGTMGLYAHLDLASAVVRPGQRVRAGQVIARSGNTGFSSGPHLHFVIQQNTGMNLISIPFEFRLPEGKTGEPQEKTWLRGLNAQ